MRMLIWQWGRRGAGPRFAASLVTGLAELADATPVLSLAAGAEILHGPNPPRCDLPVQTYNGVAGFLWRAVRAPWLVWVLARALHRLNLDSAVCAMSGPLDLMMVAACRRAGLPVGVIVHDATPHPGDGLPFQFALQRALLRRADLVIVLSAHVAAQLRQQRDVRIGTGIVVGSLPPFDFGVAVPSEPRRGPQRVLMFGRLLPYKGLDLLLQALQRLGPRPDMTVRVVGSGPESDTLAALRGCPGVTVENRWVPELEVGALLAWSDILVLPYREASQSGVAAAALAAGRRIVATRVGGLAQQLSDEPLATLCEPDGAGLADAIVTSLAMPAGPHIHAADPAAGWRQLAGLVVAGMCSLPMR